MASIDPLQAESFAEENNALLKHASFLRDQLQRNRDELNALIKINKKNELTEADRKMVTKLQNEIVNTVKDLDETTKKIAALLDIPIVDTENIPLNKQESEQHAISPLPIESKSILSRLPKILVPLAEEKVVRFGDNDEEDDAPREISNSSTSERYLRTNTSRSSNQLSQSKLNEELNKTITEMVDSDLFVTADKNSLGQIGVKEMVDYDLFVTADENSLGQIGVKEPEDSDLFLTAGKNSLEQLGAREMEDPDLLATAVKNCLEQLTVKDAILNDLKSQLKQRQCQLMKLNAQNELLRKEIDDIKTQEINEKGKADEDLTSVEFQEKYSTRLENKYERLKSLKTQTENQEAENDKIDFKNRKKEMEMFERDNDNSDPLIEKQYDTSSSVHRSSGTLNKSMSDINLSHTSPSDLREFRTKNDLTIKSIQSSEYREDDGGNFEDPKGRMYERANKGYEKGRQNNSRTMNKYDCIDCPVEDRQFESPIERTEKEMWEAIQRIGAEDEGMGKLEKVLHQIEAQRESIESWEAKILHLKELMDSGDVDRRIWFMIHEQNDEGDQTITSTENQSQDFLRWKRRCQNQSLLKAKLAKDRELKKICRCVALEEAQTRAAIEKMLKGITSVKAERLSARAELRRTERELKKLNAEGTVEMEAQKTEELKSCLRKIVGKLAAKREELEDKKKFLGLLEEKIAQEERRGARTQFCEGANK